MTLDTLLDSVQVLAPGMWENETGPQDWHAVCDDYGIIAYFANEADACGFRLWLINSRLNGGAAAKRYQEEDAA